MTRRPARRPDASRRTGRGRRKTEITSPFEPDRREAERLVTEMLALSGTSGSEGPVVRFIVEQLRRAGVPDGCIHRDRAHHRSVHGGEVGNLACRLPGTRRGGRRLLMAHMDTVPLCEGARPVRRGRWIVPADKGTALGADDRAGAAVILVTLRELLKRDLPHPPVSFFWTVQEELGLHGARHAGMSILGRPKLAFNFDGGSACKLTVAATGGYRMDITIKGVASHAGGAPELGVSAIAVASLAVAELHREGWHGRIEKNGRFGTSNVGTIRGGHATNVVAPSAELRAEARSHDPAFRRKIIRAIERAFRKAARSVRNTEGVFADVRFDGRLDYEAFKLPDDDPSPLVAEAAVRSSGGRPERAVSNGGLDANWMTARDVPTVTLGCGQVNQHTTDERLDLDEYYQACRIALRLAAGGENG